MKAKEIRQKFLDFFKSKEHLIVPSAPLVVKNDPTLMFTNAGMNQFKDYFLGNQASPSPRIADTQKCLRVSGKHNDLEEVGLDTYHHTMFEMLGNWSFGNYFKKEAIEWAWELLTEVYELPKDRLYATVFEGDKEDNLPADEEAFELWKQFLPEDRILYASKKDNFWEMGDTGPCGPCSEIHIDLRTDEEREKTSGRDLVNQDDPQVVEIWNLVFMQFNRLANKQLEALPAQHVDTGMGFERLAMAIQDKKSNYDTDVFQPLIQQIAEKAGVEYGKEEQIDIAIRVISDHIRAIAFAISDGQLPSNNRAGYVIRRILRRAVRYGYTYLDFKEPFLYTLIPTLSEQFSEIFPEIQQQQDLIGTAIREEENSFLRTLEQGLKRLDKVIEDKKEGDSIEGKVVFELYDTFGFPKDLTALVAREKGLEIDEAGFDKEMQKQKDAARKDAAKETGDWVNLIEGEEVEFVGYDQLEASTHILKYRPVTVKKKTQYQIVLSKTPFYAESGGQIGDTGYLFLESENLRIPIIDTKKENDLIVHYSPSDDFSQLDNLDSLVFKAVVNIEKRHLTENNHSATHLLHAALKQVLGDHVGQKGSLVTDKVLRFDFSHFSKMTEEEITQVEHIVNQKIRENIHLEENRKVPFNTAVEEMHATALFGEKYGDFVRVITFDEHFSRELCGGTHVLATGKIGFLKIVSEGSVAAGIRRIEAVTADAAEVYVNEQIDLVSAIKEMLKQPKDLIKAVESLVKEKAELSKEIEQLENQQVQSLREELINKVEKVGEGDIQMIAQKVALPSADALKNLVFDLRAKVDNLYAIIASDIKGKPQIAVMISDSLVQNKGLNAGKIIKDLAKEIKGGGGGQAFFATAGGKDIKGLDKVVERAKEFI